MGMGKKLVNLIWGLKYHWQQEKGQGQLFWREVSKTPHFPCFVGFFLVLETLLRSFVYMEFHIESNGKLLRIPEKAM